MGIYQGFEEEGKEKIRKITKNFLNSEQKNNKVIIGDFNEITSEMDYTATQAQARRPRGRLYTLLSNHGMIDVIRHINPKAHTTLT